MSKFEQLDAKVLELNEGISNVRTASIMNATAEQAEHNELKTKVSVLAGAYEAMLENGNLSNFQALQNRLAAVESAQSRASRSTEESLSGSTALPATAAA